MKRKWQRNWKQKWMKKLATPVLAGMMLLSSYNTALANPSGGVVTAGAAAISTSGSTMTVNQTTNKAAINWQSFGIGSGETVRFIQPSASSVALNRVVGGNASAIFGTLSANGKVFLINPNGILFAPGSQVNVGGLVASTLNLSDSDFLKGNYTFANNGSAASVVNRGAIRTADGGYVAFLGPKVSNEGIVAAQVVGLAAGDKVSLDFTGDKLLSFSVNTQAAGAAATNSGNLLADGGTVVMTTGTKDALLSTVVNNTGLIQARTVNNQSGKIILVGGTVDVGGTLDASAPNGGNGGFVETSGANINMAPSLLVTTRAPQGKTGTWLVDPGDYTIGTGVTTTNYWNNADLSTALGTSGITITTNDATTGTGNGDINVNAPVSWSANKLTLSAYRNINIKSNLTATGASSLDMISGTSGSGVIDYGLTASGFTGKVDFGTRSGSGFLTINGNPYTVITSLGSQGSTTGTDLQGINASIASLSGNYFLGADIDASATSGWNSNGSGGYFGFAPIGFDYNNAFTGSFDGGGHTITGLTINRPAQYYVGLFGDASGATLANVGLTAGSVTGDMYIGGLAGKMGGGSITASFSKPTVNGNRHIGGLIGYASGSVSIANSHATGTVTANALWAGGLIGFASGSVSITDSYATGTVSGSGYIGGLVGLTNNNVSITGSYATGNVVGGTGEGDCNFGGLVGYLQSGGAVTGSYSTGNVSGNDHVGGLIGENEGAVTRSYATGRVSGRYYIGGLAGQTDNDSNISGSYATGSVSGEEQIGGLVGYQSAGSISSSYATGRVSGTNYIGGLVGNHSDGSIGDSYATGGVSGTNRVGGLVGQTGNGSSISGSYATGSVSATGDYAVLGGLVGEQHGSISSSYATGSVSATGTGAKLGGMVGYRYGNISGSYATGRVSATGTGATRGGLVGIGMTYPDGSPVGTVTNSYWNTETSGQASSDGGAGLTTVQLMSGLPTGFDSATWGIVSDVSYPYLLWRYPTTPQVVSGLVKDAGGATLAGVTVQTLANGTLMGGATSGANGFYYMLLGNNSIADSKSVLSFAGAQGGAAAFTTAVNQNLTNFDITTGRVTASSSGALDVTALLTAAKGDNSVIAPYTVSGDNVFVSSDLFITAGGYVAQSGALAVTGATTVTAQNGAINYDITLLNNANDFTGAVSITGNNVWLQDTNALTLGASTLSGALTVNAGGAVSQTGALTVTGATTVNAVNGATKYDITLNDTANDFTGRVSLTGQNVTLRDGNALWLGGSTISGDLNVTAGGDVTQTVGLTVTGATTVNAGSHDISLWNIANNFNGAVSLSGNNVTLRGPNDLTLGEVTASGKFELSAGGNITANSAVSTRSFDLKSGKWQQVASTLPAFSASDFRISGGTFVRASNTETANIGDSTNPYQITDLYSLQGMGSNGMLDKHYVLANNIDASGTSGWNGGAGFNPIGYSFSNIFAGVFNGGEHTITGLTINRSTTNYVGLFGLAQNATLSNIGLINASVTGKSSVGGLVGYSTGSTTIAGSYVSGTVAGSTSEGANVGGLVGAYNGGTITNSYSSAAVSGIHYVGGLVGSNSGSGSITSSYATGTVSSNSTSSVNSGYFLGGLVGINYGTITYSYATGSVTGPMDVGGLVGGNVSSGSISNSYATGSVTGKNVAGGVSGTKHVGGLAGENSSGGSISYSYATGSVSGFEKVGGLVGRNTNISGDSGSVSYSYATGSVTGSTDVGGLVGEISDGGSISGSYWDMGTSGIADTSKGVGNVANASGVTGLTSAKMKRAGSFSGWADLIDGGNKIWYFYDGLTAPLLRGFLAPLTVTVAGTNPTVEYSRTAYSAPAPSYSPFDNPTLSGTLSYGKIVNDSFTANTGNAGTYNLGGLYSGQQGYAITYAGATELTITPRNISAGLTGTVEKVYDGNAAATPTAANYSLTGLIAGDVLNVSGTASYYDKNAGSGKNVSVSGLGLSGDAANNYRLASTTLSGNVGTITPKTLTAGLTGTVEKVYDGNAAATLTSANYNALSGIIGSDAVILNIATSGSYSDKNAGAGKSVTVSGLGLSGDAAGNYQLASTTLSGNVGTITPATLTITAATNTKVYDGTTSSTATPTYSGLVAGDSLSGLVQTYGSKNVLGTGGSTLNVNGGYTLTDGNSGHNYTVVTQTAIGTITPKTLTAGLTGTVEKVYDGNAAATLTGANYSAFSGIVGIDAVSLNIATSGSYSDKNVNLAGNKAVSVSGLSLAGADAANYQLASSSISGNVGTITPKTLTTGLTGTVEKVYDGNAAATLTGANYSALSGIIGSEAVALNIATSGSYSDKNVNLAGNKAVSVSGLSLAGADAANYQLASSSISGNVGMITPATLTAGLTGTVEKVYDGTNTATLTSANYNALSGIIGSDAVALNIVTSGSYSDKNVNLAGNKAVSVSGLSLAGADAANYQLASTTLSGNIGTINPARLTIAANNASRQIGVENPPFSVTPAGLVSGDSLTSLTGLLSYATPATKDSPAGTYAITPSGLTSDNYTISWVDGVLTVNRPADAYVSALASVTGLTATPPPMPMLIGTGFTGVNAPPPTGGGSAGTAAGTSPGTNEASGTSASSTGTPTSTTPAGPPTITTQVPGLPLTLTGPGINTGGHPVIITAEQE